jgi:hypothetical protein
LGSYAILDEREVCEKKKFGGVCLEEWREWASLVD